MRLTFALALFALAPQLSAKGDDVKITIKGGSLNAPVEITEPALLRRFSIWTGPGTSTNQPQGLIVDWSRGVVPGPRGLPIFAVEFLSTRTGKNTYRVLYAYDAAKQQGYVYIPGEEDPQYEENVWLIHRRVEGKWFHAWSEWDAVVRRLLPPALVK